MTPAEPPAAWPAGDGGGLTLTLQDLAAFLRNPVKAFFRHRLQVTFGELSAADADDESFGGQGLERWAWADDVLRASQRVLEPQLAPAAGAGARLALSRQIVSQQVERLQRAGRLPMAAPGRLARAELVEGLVPVVEAWQAVHTNHPQPCGKLPLQLTHPDDEGLRLEDWLVDLHARSPDAPPVWVDLKAGRLFSPAGKNVLVPREEALLTAWVRSLASAACGCPAEGILIGPGALLAVRPPEPGTARDLLLDLMQALRSGLLGAEPLPTALRTGVAWLQGPDAARSAYEGHFGSPLPAEGREPCLARLFADFDSLSAQPGFDDASRRLYGPYVEWLRTHVTVHPLAADDTGPAGQGDTDG